MDIYKRSVVKVVDGEHLSCFSHFGIIHQILRHIILIDDDARDQPPALFIDQACEQKCFRTRNQYIGIIVDFLQKQMQNMIVDDVLRYGFQAFFEYTVCFIQQNLPFIVFSAFGLNLQTVYNFICAVHGINHVFLAV